MHPTHNRAIVPGPERSNTLHKETFNAYSSRRRGCIGMRFHRLGENEESIEIVKSPLTSQETVAACYEVARKVCARVAVTNEEETSGSAVRSA